MTSRGRERLARPGARRHPKRRASFFFGVAVFGVVVLTAVFAPLLAPHNPTNQQLSAALLPPAWMKGGSLSHLLGTDQLGRDELSRIIFGSRISVVVGLGAALVAGLVGVPLGMLSGYLGGAVDAVMTVVLNVFIAFPFLLLALLVAAIVGPGFINTLFILGIAGWPVYARVIRAEVLSLRERGHVEAARAMGFSSGRILRRHVLPSVWPTFVVLASLQVGQMILAEAFLSFLGLGVQPPTSTWGNMLAGSENLIYSQWWLMVFPGIAILLTVLSVNFIADGVRDMLRPEANLFEPGRSLRVRNRQPMVGASSVSVVQ